VAQPLFPSSGEKLGANIDPVIEVSSLQGVSLSPSEDGNRSSLRNIVCIHC
jgi:hypothetical protein